MATLKLDGQMTVAAFKQQFNSTFGSTIRVYNGGRVADDADALKNLGLKQQCDFECRSSLTVGSFIERMMDECGLKVKVYTCDGWVAVLDGLTLCQSGKVKKNAVKADMESMIAYQRSGESAPKGDWSVVKNADGSYTVSIGGIVQDNTKGAMRQIAEAIGFEYDNDWTTHQFGAKLSKVLNGETLDIKKINGECTIGNIEYDITKGEASAYYDDYDQSLENVVIPDSIKFEGVDIPVLDVELGTRGVKVLELGKNVHYIICGVEDLTRLQTMIIHSPKGFLESGLDDWDPLQNLPSDVRYLP